MTQEQIDRIFNRQLMLAKQFGQIEEDNTGLPFRDIPNTLTDYRGQFVLRFMLTCVIDEDWEADEAAEITESSHLEELADVLHYIVELCLRVGVWIKVDDEPHEIFHSTNYFIGKIIHGLKAKPWKVNPKPTDVVQVQTDIIDLFWSFLYQVDACGFSATQLTEKYFAKAEVNQQRITSGA